MEKATTEMPSPKMMVVTKEAIVHRMIPDYTYASGYRLDPIVLNNGKKWTIEKDTEVEVDRTFEGTVYGMFDENNNYYWLNGENLKEKDSDGTKKIKKKSKNKKKIKKDGKSRSAIRKKQKKSKKRV